MQGVWFLQWLVHALFKRHKGERFGPNFIMKAKWERKHSSQNFNTFFIYLQRIQLYHTLLIPNVCGYTLSYLSMPNVNVVLVVKNHTLQIA